MMSTTKFKAAAVHAAPVYMDKAATLKKVVELIKQAGEEGISLLVFPETFVPGYPVESPPLSPPHPTINESHPPQYFIECYPPSTKSPP